MPATTRVGTLIVRLNAITRQFRSEMNAAVNKMKTVEHAAVGASESIASAFAVIGVAAAVGVGAAVKLAAEWERTEAAFTTMLHSGERAHRFLVDLEHFVDVTPFELPGMLRSARRLKAFGFEAEEIIPVMTAVGNATAAIGGGEFEIYRITYALGQMRAKGRIMAEEMSRQLGQIIPSWEFLAESLGITVGQAMEMVEKNAIPVAVGIQAILDGITRRWGNAMLQQHHTLIGQWSTLKDRVRVVTRGIGAYFIETLYIDWIVKRLSKSFAEMSRILRNVRFENLAETMEMIFHRILTPEVRLIVIGIAGAVAGVLYAAFVKLLSVMKVAGMAFLPFIIKGTVLTFVVYNLHEALTRSTSVIDKVTAGLLALGVVAYFAYSVGIVSFITGIKASIVAMYAKIVAVTTLKERLILLYTLLSAKLWKLLILITVVTLGAVAAMNIFNRAAAQSAKQINDLADYQDRVMRSSTAVAVTQKEMAKQMEEADKAARRNIMSFDQVHTLQEEVASAAKAIAMPTLKGLDAPFHVPPVTLPDIVLGPGPFAQFADEINKFKESMENAISILKYVGYVASGIVAVKLGILIGQWILLGATAVINAAKVAGAWLLVKGKALLSLAAHIPVFAGIVAGWVWMTAVATINAAKVAGAWLLMKVKAIPSALVQIAQFALLVGKWLLLGSISVLMASVLVGAWLLMKVKAIASTAVQIGQFALLIGKWILVGATATLMASIVAGAWLVMKAKALLSLASHIPVFAGIVAGWVSMAATAATNAAKQVAAWLLIKTRAALSLTAHVPVFAAIVAGWVSMAATATARAAVMAAAWLTALGPKAWVIAAVAAIATAVGLNWDNIVNWTRSRWGTALSVIEGIVERIRSAVNTAIELANRLPLVNIPKIPAPATQQPAGRFQTILQQGHARFGQGGADYHQLTRDQQRQMEATAQRLKTDVAFRQSEIERAQSVIAARKEAGLDISAQQRYLSSLTGMSKGGVVLGNRPTPVLLHPPEAVVPLRSSRAAGMLGGDSDTLADAIGNAVFTAVREAIRVSRAEQGREGQGQEVVLEIDGTKIGRAILPTLTRERQRLGIAEV